MPHANRFSFRFQALASMSTAHIFVAIMQIMASIKEPEISHIKPTNARDPSAETNVPQHPHLLQRAQSVSSNEIWSNSLSRSFITNSDVLDTKCLAQQAFTHLEGTLEMKQGFPRVPIDSFVCSFPLRVGQHQALNIQKLLPLEAGKDETIIHQGKKGKLANNPPLVTSTGRI